MRKRRALLIMSNGGPDAPLLQAVRGVFGGWVAVGRLWGWGCWGGHGGDSGHGPGVFCAFVALFALLCSSQLHSLPRWLPVFLRHQRNLRLLVDAAAAPIIEALCRAELCVWVKWVAFGWLVRLSFIGTAYGKCHWHCEAHNSLI